MKEIKILPSLLSADFSNLSCDVYAARDANADGLHCDIMDGHFVPNISFGPMVVSAIKPLTSLDLYVHLMIENPDNYIEAFAKAGAYEITVHAEACVHLHRTLQNIKSLGVKSGVALNPHTSISVLENVITDIDSVLIMTVNPGFGGQSFIETMVPKIEKLRQMVINAQVDIDIAVDGGIDVNTIGKVTKAGANLIVAGSSVYSGNMSVQEACLALKNAGQKV